MYALEDTHFWFVAKTYYINTFLSFLTKTKGKILDVGSGTGGNSNNLKRYGEVTCLDQNDLAISLCKKRGLKTIKGEAEKLPFKKNVFDLVTIFDVLYHKNIKDVSVALCEAKRVLKTNGHLLITDSAFDFIKSGHDADLGGKRRFTLDELTKELTNNGFIIINKSYTYFSVFPFVIIKRLIINKIFKNKNGSDIKSINPMVNNLILKILKLESKLIRHTRLPWGSSLIILAKKTKNKLEFKR